MIGTPMVCAIVLGGGLHHTRHKHCGLVALFFFGARIRLGKILGRFSINYFSGLGLRIRVRVWVGVRVSVVIWSG